MDANLTDLEFQQICHTCDELLKSGNYDLARISISWLHPIRMHPTFNLKYQCLYKPWDILILGLILTLSKSLLQLAILLFKSLAHLRLQSVKAKKVDFLIISHLTNKSQLTAGNCDLYFRELVATLRGAKISADTVYINHIKEKTCYVEKNGVKHNLIPAPIGFWGTLWVIKTQLLEFCKLIFLLPSANSTLKRKVVLKSAVECLSSSTSFNLVLAINIKKYLAHTDIKAIITTFEGHSWERVVYHVAKKYNPETLCFGYQHAFIFSSQHGALRGLSKANDPDYILAAGDISKSRLLQNSDWSEKNILLIGRSAGIVGSPQIDISRNKLCLVIPEGIETECEVLFKYSLECAEAYPDVEFIWRLHPIINFSDLKKKYSFLSNLPKNVNLSQVNLATDASRARWVLYRGSMAVVEACLMGAGPIFLKKSDFDLRLDPLEDLIGWRAVVTTKTDLGNVFESSFPSRSDLENITEYCRKIFTNFNGKALIEQFRAESIK